MKKKIFIATVQIAVEASEVAEAQDAMSECLTHNLMQANAIVDWQYLSIAGVILEPVEVGEFTVPVEEFEVFNSIKR